MFRAIITIPPKAEPYTQADMDAVIGHPVVLNLGLPGEEPTKTAGTIIAAEIQPDGSAVVTMELSHPAERLPT